MKKLSLVLCFALMLVLVLAFNVFAATQTNIEDSARFEQNGSNSDLLDLKLVKDNNYYTGSSCGNSGENWVNYRFYYDEGTVVSKVFVVLNSTGTLSNGKVYETVSTNGYEFYVRLYDKFGNAIFNTKYHSINNATEVKDGNENVLYTYFEIEFETPYSDIYMVEVPVVNNKNADVGLWEVEIYDYVCDEDKHEWVGTLCGEHCDVCGTVKNPTLACEAEEDDGDCRTAVLCKYCDAVIVASKQHVFAKGETVCSNDGCVFEGKNITSSTTITPVDASDYPDAVDGKYYAGNGEYITWHYISSRICDGNYTTAVHSNYWDQYKFGFELNEATKLSEIFIVSNSSGTYHHWGYEFDNLTSDLAIKVIIYDADGNAIQTVEYQSLDFTNPNVVPIYAENGKMTSVAYKLDTNYATAKKVEVYINGGIFEVEIYEHVTCDYQFVETVAPGCTTGGYDIYRCACGIEEQRNAVDALGHSYDDGVVTKEATDLEDGEIVYTCATCGDTKTLAIPATGGHEHDYNTYVENSLEPTCATVGSATYSCRCGETTEVEIPATGNHNYTVFVEYVEGKAPTYLYDGIGIYKCETCDDTDEIEVSRLIMNTVKYSEVSVPEGTCWVVGPKYLVDGNYMFGSGGSHSSNTYTINFVYGEDYYFDKIFIVTNSTGTQGTSDPWQNPFTSETMTTRAYYFTVSLLDENGSEVYSHRYHTSDCSLYVGVDSEGFEFDYQALTIEFEEACVAYSMSITVECKQNNSIGLWEVETYGLPVNYHEDHTYTVLLETTTVSTCTAEGWGLYRCNRCEETQEHAIPMLAHTFNQEVEGTRVDSTCAEAGSVTMKCANCDATEVQSIDAKGHTEVTDAAVAPTCTETGLTEGKHCDVCGEIIVAQETVDALGHTPSEDGSVCTECNATLIAAYIGETPYATLEEAYAAANAGDTITLFANIDLASTLYVDKKVTINLNGKTIKATNDTVGDGVFCSVANGELIIVGDGTVNGLANNPYSMAIWAKGGIVIIEGGTYTNVGATSDFDGDHFDLIYVSEGGYVEITGGSFACETPEWTLNSKNSAPGTINVYGGTFTGFNPFANKDGECFLAAGYCSTEEADGTYTVGYYYDDNHTHSAVGEGDYTRVDSTCVSTGYLTDKCYDCGKKFYVLYGIDTEYGHDYLEEAVTGGCKYTCKICGNSYTEITLGTSQDPIVAVIGDNTVTIYVDGAEDVWYYLPVTEPGVYTVTVDSAEVGVKHAPSAMALYRAQFTTGQTTYEIKVDPDNGSQYPIVFTSNIKSFTLSFEAKPYPVIVPGNNNVELEDGTDSGDRPITNNKVVFSTAGTFVLSFTEELTDVEVSVAYFHPMFGFTTEYVEFPYTLTVEEGQSAKIIINSYNPETKNVTINVACVEHSYNSVVTAPTCTEDGYTTYTCTVCGDTYTEEGEAALGHDYADATCVAPKTCKVCGATEGEALGHTEVIDAAVAPTCTETGLTEGKHCSVCNTVLVEQTVVDATGHTYGDPVYDKIGYTVTCTACGDAIFTRVAGTAQLPFDATIGDNTNNYGTEQTFWQFAVAENGTVTITMPSADISFMAGPMLNPRVMTNCTGSTSYEFEVTAYSTLYLAINACETESYTFGLAFKGEEKVYVTEGEDAAVNVTVENNFCAGTTVYFKSENGGTYVITLVDGELNASITDITNDSYIEEYPYEFTLAAGEEIMLIVATDDVMNLTEDTINFVISEKPSHVCDTAVEIPATFGYKLDGVVYPGMTSGAKCSVCGKTTITPVEASSGFEIPTASLTLSQDINVKYTVNIPAGYSNVYATFKLIDVDTSELVYVYEENADTSKDRTVEFLYNGLKFYYMNELIEARIYATNEDGRTVAFENNVMSVAYYSTRLLNAYASYVANGNPAAIKLCTLISDLLIAGDMTQIYEGYETDNLVSVAVKAKGAVLTPSTSSLDDVTIPQSAFTFENNEAGKDIRWSGASLSIGQSTYMKLSFNAADIEGLTVKITIGSYDPIYVNASDLGEPNSKGQYTVELKNIRAKEYGVTIKAEFLKDGEAIENGAVIYSSINTYLYNMRNNSNVNIKNLVRALYNYGAAVYAYEN